MKILIFLILFTQFASAEISLNKPVMILKGHYTLKDGRVKGHKFPIEIKLNSDWTFSGTYENWIEEWLSNGKREFSYFNSEIKGNWKMNESSIQLFSQNIPFIKSLNFNGLKIEFVRKKPGNKSPGLE